MRWDRAPMRYAVLYAISVPLAPATPKAAPSTSCTMLLITRMLEAS